MPLGASASIRVHLTKDLIIKFVYVRCAPIVVPLFHFGQVTLLFPFASFAAFCSKSSLSGCGEPR